MRQYYVLNMNPRASAVFEFIQYHNLPCEVHLNRTRFWVPEGSILTEFVLRFADSCPHVDASMDLTTGRPINE
jgi:hypothetical protein